VILVLGERSISVDFTNADLPELFGEDFENCPLAADASWSPTNLFLDFPADRRSAPIDGAPRRRLDNLLGTKGRLAERMESALVRTTAVIIDNLAILDIFVKIEGE
jgi:hypothetical protein